MNKGHDVGGQLGFGPIPLSREDDEAVFQAAWEARVFALTTAIDILGKWNSDESRGATENQKAEDYFEKSYYENWLFGLEQLLIQKGLITSEELATGVVSLNPDLRELISLRANQVEDYVYDDLNLTSNQLIYAGINNLFGEVVWFYPTSTSNSNNRAVFYSYLDSTAKRPIWFTIACSLFPITTWEDSSVFGLPHGTKYNASEDNSFE